MRCVEKKEVRWRDTCTRSLLEFFLMPSLFCFGEFKIFKSYFRIQIKSLPRTNVLNDVTAAPFLVGFFTAGSLQKNTKNGAAVIKDVRT